MTDIHTGPPTKAYDLGHERVYGQRDEVRPHFWDWDEHEQAWCCVRCPEMTVETDHGRREERRGCQG